MFCLSEAFDGTGSRAPWRPGRTLIDPAFLKSVPWPYQLNWTVSILLDRSSNSLITMMSREQRQSLHSMDVECLMSSSVCACSL